ncbi:hypothetical protein D3C78_916060 [compost metagenome]
MAGGAHFQIALGVSRQNPALEVKTPRRFFQARSGPNALAHRQTLRRVAGQFCQQRLHQLIKRQRRRHRIARQAAEPAVVKLTESERFARFNRQLPEADFTQLVEKNFGVIRFANGYSAGTYHHICGVVRFDKRGAQFFRIVRNNAEVNDLAAQLFQHQMHGQTVGVVDLPRFKRLTRQLQLIARREQGNAHFAHHVDLSNTQRCQNRQFSGRQLFPGGENGCTQRDIFPGAADVLVRLNAGDKTHALVGLLGLFLHHHRVAIRWHRGTCHNANTGSLRPFTLKRLARKGFSGDRQCISCLNICKTHRITVHRGVIKPRHVQRRDDIARRYATKTAQ